MSGSSACNPDTLGTFYAGETRQVSLPLAAFMAGLVDAGVEQASPPTVQVVQVTGAATAPSITAAHAVGAVTLTIAAASGTTGGGYRLQVSLALADGVQILAVQRILTIAPALSTA